MHLVSKFQQLLGVKQSWSEAQKDRICSSRIISSLGLSKGFPIFEADDKEWILEKSDKG